MAFSKPGVRAIAFSGINTLAGSALYPVAAGVRMPANLTFKGFNEPADYRSRKLRNMVNAMFECTTLQTRTNQGNTDLLGTLSYFAKTGGCDLQILGQESVFSTNKYVGDIFSFTGLSNYMGIDFEYMLSPKGREVKLTFEMAKSYADMKDIIDASEIAESCTYINSLSASGYAGYDFTKVEMPVLKTIQSPNNTSILSIEDIDDWRITFKTKGSKSKLTNRTAVNVITCSIELTTLDASTANFKAWLALTQHLELSLGIQTGNILEDWKFAAGVNTHTDEWTLGDENRNGKFIWEADIPIGDFESILNGNEASANHNINFVL